LCLLGDPLVRAVSAESLARLEPLGPSGALVQALTEEARSSGLSGQHPQAIAMADRAIAMAGELGLPEPARAIGYLGGARAYLGEAGGVQDMGRALAAATAQGLGPEVAIIHNNLGDALWP